MAFKNKLHHIVYSMHIENKASWAFHRGMAILIIANAIAVMLETVVPIYVAYQSAFSIFEDFSVTVFSLEYVMRLWVADLNPRCPPPFISRIKYALTPMAIIDLLSILPSLLSITGIDLRMLRIMRLIRLFKLTRYSKAMHNIFSAILSRKNELIFSVLMMLMLLVVSTTLVYFAERQVQPNVFSSIPATLWWGVVTLTTIGYGDAFPVTMAGKIITSIAAMLGIGFFALPGGIVATALIEQSRLQKEQHTVCPHCGNSLIA